MTPSEVHLYVCERFDEFVENQLDFVQGRLEDARPTNWNSLQVDLVAWIRDLDPAIAFAGLIELLETEQRYQYQDLAGELLDKGDVPCPLTLAEFLLRVVPQLNASTSTVPKYAAKVFGREAVLAHIRELLSTASGELPRARLDNVRYHLGEHPGQNPVPPR